MTKMEQDKPRDPIVGFRNVVTKKNSKGGDRTQLYLGGDQQYGNKSIQEMIDVLTTFVDAPGGCKIDLHVNERKTNDGSRTFQAAFCFIKGVEPKQDGGRWVPKGTETSDTAKKVYETL